MLSVKFTITLVLLTFSSFYPFTLVVTTGTSSDLSRKVRVTVPTFYKLLEIVPNTRYFVVPFFIHSYYSSYYNGD